VGKALDGLGLLHRAGVGNHLPTRTPDIAFPLQGTIAHHGPGPLSYLCFPPSLLCGSISAHSR